MIKRTTLVLAVMCLMSQVYTQNINRAEAEKIAAAFMHSRINLISQVAFEELSTGIVLDIPAGSTSIYAVNFVSGGFVLVAGNRASVPVLGYAFEGEYSGNQQPEAFASWMEGYKQQLNQIAAEQIPSTQAITEQWEMLDNYTPAMMLQPGSIMQVSPLLPSTWDQGSRYNELCPEDENGPGGHVWAGCVATAMSQVINYWRYPLQGSGSHGYYSDYGYLSVDFGSASYDYNQMNNSIMAENNYEMAEIQYHCGVAVDMMYSPDGSGAYSDDAASALRNYFGYNSTLNLEYKDDYSDTEWASLLMDNLNNGWPMYYHGFGSGGHAFNVDGYQGSDYFHFNWGWSGSYNGYYYLDNLNPGGNNFTYGQGAIVNFYPGDNYPYYCNGLTTLTRHNGTLEDGSGPVDPYVSGLSCGWLIAPEDSISGLTLTFDKFDVTAGIDALNVYDGPDASYPLLGTYTGSALPPAIAASGNTLYIEFMTSGNTGSGWRAHYTSSIVNYCSGLTTLTEPQGTITDGSGNREYHNNTICKYKITPENAGAISISFNSLDTEPGNDVIKIYDYISQNLIGTYSGSELPGEIIVSSPKAYVLFTTNSDVQGQGWELTYTGLTTGIGEVAPDAGKLKAGIISNPVNEWLRIEFTGTSKTQVNLSLMAADGRNVIEPFVHHLNANRMVMISTAGLPDGVYFLRYRSEAGSGTEKILVKHQ